MIERQLRTGTKIGPGSASKGARYAVGERSIYLIGDRTQLRDNGLALVLSNIDGDPEKCVEFFAGVERNERKPSLDQVTIQFGQHRSLWRRVVDHPECEPAVIAAYRADPDGTAIIDLRRGAEDLRNVIRECNNGATSDLREQEDRDREDGIEWRLGRGGRTQWRVVVSFPVEFTAAQRHEALQLICDYFAAKGCMYMGVIHEAAASNDWRNNHCHIDLYDRPCRRLTGNEAQDLVNVSDRWIDEVRAEYRKGVFVDEIGRWDFEVARTVTYNSGNKRPQKVFRANKSKAMRDYSMPKDSRREIAAIVNRIAMRDLGRATVDHRTYAEMGIAKEPDQPLGPRSNALEGKGIATEVGLRNEQKHADARREEIDQRYHQRAAKLTEWSKLFIRGTDPHWVTGARFEERNLAGAALLQERELAELKRDAALLQLEINRQLSSAHHVIRTSGRVIRKREDKRGDHTVRRQNARDYWRTWVIDHADGVSLLGKMKALITAMDSRIDVEMLVAAAIAPIAAPRIGESEEPNLAHQPVVLTPLIPPWKQLDSLVQQRDTSEPSTKAILNSTLPALIVTNATTIHAKAVSSGRNLMQRKSLDDRPNAIGALDTKKSISPPERGTVIGAPQSAAARVALSVPIAPAGAGPASASNSVFNEASSSSTPSTGSEGDAEIAKTSETARAETPLVLLAENKSNASHSASSTGHADDPEKGGIGDREAPPRMADDESFSRRHADPADEIGTSSGAKSARPEPTYKSLDEQVAPTFPKEAEPNKRLRMDVGKENEPRSRPPSGAVADRQPVGAEMHLRQLAVQAQPTGSADVSQTTATNTSNVNVVRVVDNMLAAFVIRLEERKVRLAEIDGKIVAAPWQPLERGDEPFIQASQSACRALKARQDGLVMAVAKALWLTADPIAAGRHTDIDPLILLLSKKWADDPFIASGLRHLERQKAIVATQQKASIAPASTTASLIQRGVPPVQEIGIN